MAYRLYEGASHAKLYAKFRPTYPPIVRKLISDFIKKNGGDFQRMIDVACGSGQSTFHMADIFEQVHGIDISQEQVHHAQEKLKQLNYKNVKFCVGAAEKLPFADGSVDLVTCGTSLHWFDSTTFYPEVDRVLKHKGCLAAYGYSHVEAKSERAKRLTRHFFNKTLEDYWSDRVKCYGDRFKELKLPYVKSQRYDFYSDEERKLPDLIGYIRSVSAYRKYCELHPGNDILEELEHQLHKEFGPDTPKDQTSVYLQFPMFLLIGQKE